MEGRNPHGAGGCLPCPMYAIAIQPRKNRNYGRCSGRHFRKGIDIREAVACGLDSYDEDYSLQDRQSTFSAISLGPEAGAHTSRSYRQG